MFGGVLETCPWAGRPGRPLRHLCEPGYTTFARPVMRPWRKHAGTWSPKAIHCKRWRKQPPACGPALRHNLATKLNGMSGSVHDVHVPSPHDVWQRQGTWPPRRSNVLKHRSRKLTCGRPESNVLERPWVMVGTVKYLRAFNTHVHYTLHTTYDHCRDGINIYQHVTSQQIT